MLTFKPCPTAELKPTNGRVFTPIERHACVDHSLNRDLIELAELRISPIPNMDLNGIGRTIYSELAEKRSDLSALKIKGVAGLVKNKNGFKLVEPSPDRILIDNQPHLAFDDKFNPRIVQGDSKFWHTHHANRAAREFECHKRLSDLGVAFKPLIAGVFRDDRGVVISDLFGKPTGAIIIQHDPDYYFQTQFNQFYVLEPGEDQEGLAIIKMGGRRFLGDIQSYLAVVGVYCEGTELVGSAKRIALEYGLMTRHVSHGDNVFLSSDMSTVKLSDLDSCLLLDLDSDQNMWGPQVVRDLASNLVRDFSNFTWMAASELFLISSGFEMGPNPITSYLSGFFKDDLSKDTIESCGKDIMQYYFEQVFSKKVDSLKRLTERKAEAFFTGNTKVLSELKTIWLTHNLRLLPKTLSVCYDLIAQSRLRDQGFKLSKIPKDELARKLLLAGKMLYQAYKIRYLVPSKNIAMPDQNPFR